MGKALIGGLLSNNLPKSAISMVDPSPSAREDCESTFKIKTFGSPRDAMLDINVVVLAVKPNIVQEVLEELANICEPGCLFISVAAGIKISKLQISVGEDKAIIRAMPNTPALVRRGVTALKANEYVREKDKEAIEEIFGSVGLIRWVEDEGSLDAVTAISGSGPAYFFLFTELLQRAAVEIGLSEDLARDLASETFCGSAALFDQAQESASVLRDRVTSPGGTTEKALDSFRKNNLYDCLLEAIKEAHKRSQSLSR